MTTRELTQYSIGFAFDLLAQVAGDLTQEQADWMPPGTANPIGALYWHTISYVDQIVHRWAIGGPSLMKRAGWQQKVVVAARTGPGGPYGGAAGHPRRPPC